MPDDPQIGFLVRTEIFDFALETALKFFADVPGQLRKTDVNSRYTFHCT